MLALPALSVRGGDQAYTGRFFPGTAREGRGREENRRIFASGGLRSRANKKEKDGIYFFQIHSTHKRKKMPTSSHPSIAKLQAEIRAMLPRLSVSQANVLGEMAYAMLMIDGCGLTRMCSYMAELLDQPENTLRQKYREMYYEKEAKAGVKKRQQKRREIVVDEHFADLLRAVITGWQGEKTLVLAI